MALAVNICECVGWKGEVGRKKNGLLVRGAGKGALSKNRKCGGRSGGLECCWKERG